MTCSDIYSARNDLLTNRGTKVAQQVLSLGHTLQKGIHTLNAIHSGGKSMLCHEDVDWAHQDA